MYVVKDSNNNTVALCSRPEDAQAWVQTRIDGSTYRVEKQGLSETAGTLRSNEGIKKT